MKQENYLAGKVIGAAIEVHKRLGPGLLESAYSTCLAYELRQLKFRYEREKVMPIVYKEIKLDHGYRIDILVENKLVLELKTVEAITDMHIAQTATYLRLGGFKLGLLLNFNGSTMKAGIKRVVI